MLEKDIENLIAQHPDELFPDSGLKLKGQQIKLGRCFADIIFTDKHNRTIVVEVKRGILSRDASGQIMEYYGILKEQNNDAIVELVLCANVIPPERKTFLERAGIECKEISVSTVVSLAKKYNYTFKDEISGNNQIHGKELSYNNNVWVFQANPDRYDILNALSDPKLVLQRWQINQHKKEIHKGDIALVWMCGKEAGIYAVTEIVSEPSMLKDFEYEEKYWLDQSGYGVEKLRAEMKLIKNLTNKPLYRKDIKMMPGMENFTIIRINQGTNFPVTKEEWNILKKELQL